MERLAKALGVRPHELIYDPQEEIVPIVGYVGAGSEAHYYADAQNVGEYARMPVNGSSASVAVEIRGTSLGPALDGWLAYYDDVRAPPTHDMMRRLCVVGLEDDRVLVKLLYPGTGAGLYNLHSNTSEPIIENVAIRWAALVVDIARR